MLTLFYILTLLTGLFFSIAKLTGDGWFKLLARVGGAYIIIVSIVQLLKLYNLLEVIK